MQFKLAWRSFPTPTRSGPAIRSVSRREELYSGAFVENSPDLLVNFHRGFRVSWQSAVGGFAHSVLEDNMRRWSGDHIVDPESVPGILFMNRATLHDHARIIDLAPTILNFLGVAVPHRGRQVVTLTITDMHDSDDMKICVLGLDCAAPEIIFGDERLVNLRRLMDLGVYGRLESVVPPITVPAWMCMSTSQDPGSLGVYGFRNRSDHSYDKLGFRQLGFHQGARHLGPAGAGREEVDHRGRAAELSSAAGKRHQHRLFSHAGHGQE